MGTPRMSAGVPIMCGGVPSLNCCVSCCQNLDDVTLYLTISNFTIDSGSTCPGSCTATGVTAKPTAIAYPRSSPVWDIQCDDGYLYGVVGLSCNTAGAPGTIFNFGANTLGAFQIRNCPGTTAQCFINLGTSGGGTGLRQHPCRPASSMCARKKSAGSATRS